MEIALQFIKLLGGLGMFLFGMHTMSTGLERSTGDKMRKIMGKVTGNLIKSVALGTVVAALTQSSSATTVMVVGFVNAGVLNLTQAVGIIMGANIGTTVTAWLLSLNAIQGSGLMMLLKPSTLAPIALVVGAFLMFFSGNGKKRANVGEIITGIGVLFIGMEYMSGAMEVVFTQVPALSNAFSADVNPIFGIALGAGITAIIQSSSASVGMLQAVASTGVLTFSATFPIIMGQNIGTCITALMSGIGASKNAKRAAMIHLYFNIIGTLIFMILIYAIQYTVGLAFWDMQMNAVDISIFHSIFNISTTLLLLPFSKFLVWLANITIKDAAPEQDNPFALLDKRFLSTPPIAIDNVRKCMSQMCKVAMENVANCRDMLKNKSTDLLKRCAENEDTLDHYEIVLTDYLTQLSDTPLGAEDNQKVAGYFPVVNNIERIGDYCDNICDSIKRITSRDISFSPDAEHDLGVLFKAVEEITDLTFHAFSENDLNLARKIEPLEEVVDSIQEKLEKEHMTRLKAKQCSVEAGVVFLEIISNLERISDHCSNIGVAILQSQFDAHLFDRHEYLRQLHSDMPPEYLMSYNYYKKKYSLE